MPRWMKRTCRQICSAHGVNEAFSIAMSTASCCEISSRLEAHVFDTKRAKTRSTPRISARPQRLSRRSRRGVGSAGGRPLPASGVPALVDTESSQEEVADEVRQEDEEEPPEPPQVVRPPLEELDDREPHDDGERE